MLRRATFHAIETENLVPAGVFYKIGLEFKYYRNCLG